MTLGERVRSLAAGVAWDPVELYEKIAAGEAGAPDARAGLALVGGLAALLGLAATAVSSPGTGLFTGAILVFAVFVAASTTIWSVSRLLGGRAPWGAVLTAWAGSYLPTAIWFGGLILAHWIAQGLGASALIPVAPLSFPDATWFQVLFLAFTLAMFLWKSLLLYLNLRILGGLDFRRIVLASLILGAVVMGYWYLGLAWHWFKVPII